MSSTVVTGPWMGSTRDMRGVRAPRARQAQAPLRLTRRGRVVVRLVLGVLVLAAVAAVVLLGGGAAMAGRDTAPLPVEYRVVHAGETLWGIASEVAPDADPRDTVAQIIELNQLSGAQVPVGARLAVPVRG